MPIFLFKMPRNIQFIVLLCYLSATLAGGADLLAQGNEGGAPSASAALENPVQYKARDSAVGGGGWQGGSWHGPKKGFPFCPGMDQAYCA